MSEHDDSFEPDALSPSVLVGSWADSTHVHRGRDEVTIDFVRHVPHLARPVLVARALVSHVVAVELRHQLDEAWRGYRDWSMPEKADDD